MPPVAVPACLGRKTNVPSSRHRCRSLGLLENSLGGNSRPFIGVVGQSRRAIPRGAPARLLGRFSGQQNSRNTPFARNDFPGFSMVQIRQKQHRSAIGKITCKKPGRHRAPNHPAPLSDQPCPPLRSALTVNPEKPLTARAASRVWRLSRCVRRGRHPRACDLRGSNLVRVDRDKVQAPHAPPWA